MVAAHCFPGPFMKIMILEDNENDIAMLQDAVARCGVTDPIYFVRDAEGVIDYLTGKNAYADRKKHPLPNILLIDLNLPHASGMELLEWFKENPAHRLPTLILTSSTDEKDMVKAYDLCASTYFLKPQTHSQLCALLKVIYDYWSLAQLPGQKSNTR
jgi:DNA-binding response OmpR family regulator